MADELKATPRNALLGLLADALSGANDYAQRADRTMPGGRANPVLALLADNIGLPGAARTADRLSYGEPLTTGKGWTTQVRPDTWDALMFGASAAPFVSRGALKASDAAVRAITGNPEATATGVVDYARSMAPALNPATVWHGSPHKFDAFDSSKIGTGEGAQAYGHGLYFADAPEVANSYAAMADSMPVLGKSGAQYRPKFNGSQADLDSAISLMSSGAVKTPQEGLSIVQGELNKSTLQGLRSSYPSSVADAQIEASIPARVKRLSGLRDAWQALVDDAASHAERNLYKVDLPDSAIAKMLDWDKPLSQQAEGVTSAVRAALPPGYVNGRYVDPYSSGRVGQALMDDLQLLASRKPSGMRTPEKAMQAAGIPGIRYLDGGSRGAGAGTSNYVVFDDKLLTILERNGVPLNALQEAARGR